MKRIFWSVLIPLSSGFAGAALYLNLQPVTPVIEADPASRPQFQQVSNYPTSTPAKAEHLASLPQDFTAAAANSTPSVVFIKSISGNDYQPTSYFDYLFGRRNGPRASSGSGVIYSEDGYIVTNNHVVEGASRIEIMHMRRTYQAKLIGTDPSTDLAVLKVETTGLPAIQLARSSDVEVGEWVLAVGNPFNLTSTVTAGIISAKGREISLTKGLFPLESFIQTDAAINPGNSGGALVDTEGKLVGINTAILSQTGSYAGYGFAVPVDIVRKVVDDLINYGEVQKAFLGADVIDLDIDKAASLNVKASNGVVIKQLSDDGAASRAGLKVGDIIISVNGFKVIGHGQFDELLSYYSPGDEVTLSYVRKNQERQTKARLTNREGTTEVLKRQLFTSATLGADLEIVSKVERNKLNIEQGVRVTNLRRGVLARLGVQDGYIISQINDTPIDSPQTLVQVLSQVQGRTVVEVVNSEGTKGYYQVYVR